jgi:hypothetical protein
MSDAWLIIDSTRAASASMRPPDTKPADPNNVAGRHARLVTPARVAVYLHLAAVVVTAAFAWLDRTGCLPPSTDRPD